MRIRISKPGIYNAEGKEIAVGTELSVKEEPKGWEGRYEIVSGSTDGKTPVTNPEAATGYAVKDKGGAWYVITKDGEEVTKSFRKADVEGFDDMSDEDKGAFVDLHKKEA
jgi:hypothetical protein